MTQRKQTATGLVVETTTREYDALDRLKRETRYDTKQTAYEYDAKGNRTKVTDFENVATSYTFDAQDRLKTAVTPEGTTTYSYFADGLARATNFFDGTNEGRCYDDAGRLTVLLTSMSQLADGCQQPPLGYLSRHQYSYDADGNRQTQVEELTVPGATAAGNAETTQYGYDDESRLVAVAYPDNTTAMYRLDAVGNRVGERKVVSSLVPALTAAAFMAMSPAALSQDVTAVFNRADWLESVTDAVTPAKNATFEWDAAGNLTRQRTSARDRRFSWDVKQTLTRVEDNGVEAGRYDYGADGLRTKRVTAAESVEYVLDGMQVLVEADGRTSSHAAKRRYHYANAALAVTDIAGAARVTRALHLDALGSPTSETTATGGVTAVRQYDAWGQYRNGTAPGSSEAKYGYTGHQYDVETGLVYARARYYDAEYGRFLSRDSNEGAVNSAPSLHRFTYAHSNPLRYTDPTGRDALAWAKYVLGLGPPPPAAIDSCSASGRVCSEKAAEATHAASRATEAVKQFNSAQSLANFQAPVGAVSAQTAAPAVGIGVTAGVLKVAYDFFTRDSRNRDYEIERQKAQSRVDESIRRACAQGGRCEGVNLPAAEEKQGVVYEDVGTPGVKLPGKRNPPVVDDHPERATVVDPDAEREQQEVARRGPKTDPNAPHNKKIREIGQRIVDEGGEIVEGGGVLPEKKTPTLGGFKNSRRLDIKYKDKDGVLRGVLVGLEEDDLENGEGAMRPIQREREAKSDLETFGGIPTTFEPYGKKGSDINKGFE